MQVADKNHEVNFVGIIFAEISTTACDYQHTKKAIHISNVYCHDGSNIQQGCYFSRFRG